MSEYRWYEKGAEGYLRYNWIEANCTVGSIENKEACVMCSG